MIEAPFPRRQERAALRLDYLPFYRKMEPQNKDLHAGTEPMNGSEQTARSTSW
jgi:hypothetical protein